MILLFSLPKELWRDQILRFCTTKEIARASSAILNWTDQKQFRVFTDGHISTEHIFVTDSDVKQLKWCLTRNIYFSNILMMNKVDGLPMSFYKRVSRMFLFCGGPCGEKLSCIFQVCANSLRNLTVYDYSCCLDSLRTCRVLESLNVKNCPQLTYEALRQVVTGCKQLKVVSIAACALVDENTIVTLLDGLPRLISFSFGGTTLSLYNLDAILAKCTRRTISAKTIAILPHTIVTGVSLCKLVRCAPSLHALRVDCSQSEVRDIDIANLLHITLHLQELSLTNSAHITSDTLVAIARHLPFLQKLNVAGSVGVGDRGVTAVSKRCAHIKELNVSDCVLVSDVSVREIWTYCTLLELLNLSGCVRVTIAGFPVVVGIENSIYMRDLDVSGTSITGAPFLLSRKVQTLQCSNCAHKNSNLVCDGAGFPYIQYLDVAAVQLNEVDFLTLTTLLLNVQNVCISYSTATDAVLHSFMVNCPRLKGVFARGCAAVTAAAVKQLNLQHKDKKMIFP